MRSEETAVASTTAAGTVATVPSHCVTDIVDEASFVEHQHNIPAPAVTVATAADNDGVSCSRGNLKSMWCALRKAMANFWGSVKELLGVYYIGNCQFFFVPRSMFFKPR